MKVRFKLAWQTYCVGDIIEPPGTLRDWLLNNGYVEIIDTGTIEQPLTREAVTAKKRRAA